MDTSRLSDDPPPEPHDQPVGRTDEGSEPPNAPSTPPSPANQAAGSDTVLWVIGWCVFVGLFLCLLFWLALFMLPHPPEYIAGTGGYFDYLT
jgi:hypothetical protein